MCLLTHLIAFRRFIAPIVPPRPQSLLLELARTVCRLIFLTRKWTRKNVVAELEDESLKTRRRTDLLDPKNKTREGEQLPGGLQGIVRLRCGSFLLRAGGVRAFAGEFESVKLT